MNKKIIFFVLLSFFLTLPFAQTLPESPATPKDEQQENIQSETEKAQEITELPKNENLHPCQNLNIIFPQSVYNLNPHTANYSSEAQILSGLYEGLFSYDSRSLDPVSGIVDTFKVSRNKLTWTFTLKENCTLSNGEKITAEIIRQSWLTLLAPETNAPFASLLDCVVGASDYRRGKTTSENVKILAPNENTLIVKLVAPTEHLPKILCHHAFSVVSQTKDVFSGAFQLTEHNDTHIVMTKNPHYWDAENVTLEKITFYLSDDAEENTYLFNTGKAHWVSADIQTDFILQQKSISIGTQFGTEYFFFKSHQTPWNNPKIREALLYALPWETLRKDILISAQSFIVPLLGYPEVIGFSDYDLDYAKELLQENSLGENPTLTIAIPDNPRYTKIAQIMQESWQILGINVVIQPISPLLYLQNIDKVEADLLTMTWIGDFADPLAFLELFRGNSTLNESAWNNETYNTLLQEASLLSSSERYKKLAQAEQLLLDEGMLITISHPISFNVVDLSVLKGWYENPLDIHSFKSLYLEKDSPTGLIVKK